MRFEPRAWTISRKWRTSIFSKSMCKGREILVFQGALECLKAALIVDVEVDFIPLYKNQPLFADVDALLRSRGFMLHQMQHYGLTFKPKMVQHDGAATSQQTSWGDAVYVRDFPAFESWSRTRFSSSPPSSMRITGPAVWPRGRLGPMTARRARTCSRAMPV